MTDTPKYRLRRTNSYGETYWFVEMGHRWDADPKWNRGPDPHNRRLIRKTTDKREKGTVFDTLPDALAIIIQSGDSPGWLAETLDGKAVE
jgi:hypothetical protein